MARLKSAAVHSGFSVGSILDFGIAFNFLVMGSAQANGAKYVVAFCENKTMRLVVDQAKSAKACFTIVKSFIFDDGENVHISRTA